MVLPPKGARRKTKEEEAAAKDKIVIRRSSGQVIPEVGKIRVLGTLIEKHRTNGETINRLSAKVTAETRLITMVANRKAGMREDSLLRLVQSFAMSHVAHVAAFHTWRLDERNKINAMMRKAHKTALGLLDCTSTEKLLALGMHNTLEAIGEAQRAAQIERLKESKTGRAILARLGLDPGTGEKIELLS